MKIVSFIRKLGLTHVGKSGTHDYYIYFPKSDQEVIRSFFIPNKVEEFDVTDKETGKIYRMKVTFPRGGQECRIVKDFAQYVRDYDLDAGDEVIFEKRIHDEGKIEYFIKSRKYDNILIMDYKSKVSAFVTSHQSRLERLFPEMPINFQIEDKNILINVEIEKKGSYKLRGDSTDETPYYQLDGIEHFLDDRTKSSVILERKPDGIFCLKMPFQWKFHVLELGGTQ